MNTLGLRPAAGRVLLAPIVQEQTRGGLLLAAGAEQKGQVYRVVALGLFCAEDCAEARDLALLLPGDEVILGKYVGTELNWQGQDYLLARYADILAYLEG